MSPLTGQALTDADFLSADLADQKKFDRFAKETYCFTDINDITYAINGWLEKSLNFFSMDYPEN
jgi:hypothetical protein